MPFHKKKVLYHSNLDVWLSLLWIFKRCIVIFFPVCLFVLLPDKDFLTFSCVNSSLTLLLKTFSVPSWVREQHPLLVKRLHKQDTPHVGFRLLSLMFLLRLSGRNTTLICTVAYQYNGFNSINATWNGGTDIFLAYAHTYFLQTILLSYSVPFTQSSCGKHGHIIHRRVPLHHKLHHLVCCFFLFFFFPKMQKASATACWFVKHSVKTCVQLV